MECGVGVQHKKTGNNRSIKDVWRPEWVEEDREMHRGCEMWISEGCVIYL